MEAQFLPPFTSSEQTTRSLLHHFIPLGSPVLTSFYPLNKYSLTITPIYPPWHSNSYIILPPPEKLPPHSYTILSPLSAQLSHHFTPPPRTRYSLHIHHFDPWQLNSYLVLPPLIKYKSLLHLFPPWQPNSYLISPPLNKLLPHSYILLSHLADHLLHHLTPSEKYTLTLTHF